MKARDMNFKYCSYLGQGDAFCHVLLASGTDRLRLAAEKGIIL